MNRVLETAPTQSSVERGWSTLVAQNWRHGPFHAPTAAMSEHVVIAYMGASRRIERHRRGSSTQGRAGVGTLSIIPAGFEARWDIEGPLDVVHAYVAPTRLATMAEENGFGSSEAGLIDRTGYPDEVGGRLLGLLGRELDAPDLLDVLFAEHLSELVCLHFLRAHSGLSRRVVLMSKGGLGPVRLKAVCDYMEAHLDRPAHLADLVAQTGFSRTHFLRAFRQSTGTSPHRYMTGRRIENAKLLLQTTDLAIIEVGLRSGYDRADHFATAFQRLVGVSPRVYRREHRT